MALIAKRAVLAIITLSIVASAAGYVGVLMGIQYSRNQVCCLTPRARNIGLVWREKLGLARFYSQIGQDKWVLETMFPEVRDGFFVDVGSADGTLNSNTRALEERGWTGICIDPFPSNMHDRTCKMLKEVVFSESGRRVRFQASGEIGGITDTLGIRKEKALAAPAVEFTTTTLGEILDRSGAPRYIHFISLDIEGAELEALKGFPFDRYTVGAFAIEHNYEEPKRSEIVKLLAQHGYRRSHNWQQDDFYVPAQGR